MRWISLTDAAFGTVSESLPDTQILRADYQAGRTVGVVTLGRQYLFFQRLWKRYYIPYSSLSRAFRRVLAIPAKIGCCTTGEVRVENLVLCAIYPRDARQAGEGREEGRPMGAERELAQIQLPGERAARALMEDLARLAPQAAMGCPAKRADRREAGA